MEDEVVGRLLLGFVAVKKQQDVLFGEAVVADTEVLAQVQRVLETLHGFVRTGDLDLTATRHHTYIRVLVLEAEHVTVVHSVEGRGV